MATRTVKAANGQSALALPVGLDDLRPWPEELAGLAT